MTPETPLKILVVDDEPSVATALGRGLRKHQVTLDTDPEQARRRLIDGPRFDVVVSDLKMPGCDGRELLTVARALPYRLIFVLMSGDITVGDTRADAVLHKPFTVKHLQDVVESLSRRRSRTTTQRIKRPVPWARPVP